MRKRNKKKEEFKEKIRTNLNIDFDFSKFDKLENLQQDDITKEIKSLVDRNLNLKKTKLFDWVLLGIGEDGHTASLFPGQNTLDSTKFCEATRHPKTGQLRVTMAPIAINNSARITYHVIGERKSEIVSKLTTYTSSKINYPASKIPGELFLDKKAASRIDFSGIEENALLE